MTSSPLLKINTFMKKLLEFQKRSIYRNPHLYSETAKEGYDYIVCPISKCRMSMIKTSYITKILGLTVEKYDELCPGIRERICEKRRENIKIGLSRIDEKTGLTKYQASQIKAKNKLKQVDQNGKSGYKKLGEKTRNTHLSRVDEFGKNGYRRQADKRLTTILENGLTVEQNAHIKQKQKLLDRGITRSVGASKISKKILYPIIMYLQENKIKFYFDKQEYGINDDGDYYYYDLVIPDFAIAIEYQSSVWHPNPTLNEEEWNKWSTPKGIKKYADEVLARDYKKAKVLFKRRGFYTYYVWEQTQDKDVEEILCLLKTQSMKF